METSSSSKVGSSFSGPCKALKVAGVAYQAQNVTNSLTNSAQCSIDAKLIAQLGANVIRVYSIDPTLTVTGCMKAFEDQGIYALVDMTTPTYYIDRVRTIMGIAEMAALI